MKSHRFFIVVAAILALMAISVSAGATEFKRINVFRSQAIGKLGTATSEIISNIPLGITRLSFIAKVTGDGRVSVKAQGGPLSTDQSYVEVWNSANDNTSDETTVPLNLVDNMTVAGGDGSGGYFNALATTVLPLSSHYKFIATEIDNETATLSLDLMIEY